MPELPEMETYRRLLEPRIIHHRITEADVQREKSINVPVADFCAAVESRVIAGVRRIAKQLVFDLDDGTHLIVHLMLGGWMFYGHEDEKPERTIQVRLGFGTNSLYFINLRLGHLHLLTNSELKRIRGKYGPDPFDMQLGPGQLFNMLNKKRTTLKMALVDQGLIAGIGNCYSDEICYLARLLPTRICSSLDLADCEELLVSMRKVLTDATRSGGYMEHPLYVGDGLTGGYRCYVYDRAGEPCDRCGEPIVVETVGKRKTYYCVQCQR